MRTIQLCTSANTIQVGNFKSVYWLNAINDRKCLKSLKAAFAANVSWLRPCNKNTKLPIKHNSVFRLMTCSCRLMNGQVATELKCLSANKTLPWWGPFSEVSFDKELHKWSFRRVKPFRTFNKKDEIATKKKIKQFQMPYSVKLQSGRGSDVITRSTGRSTSECNQSSSHFSRLDESCRAAEAQDLFPEFSI